MTQINPCPFCGGKSRVHKYLGKWYARCNKCKAYSAPYDMEEQATERMVINNANARGLTLFPAVAVGY